MAELKLGTTIGGNVVWHAGNLTPLEGYSGFGTQLAYWAGTSGASSTQLTGDNFLLYDNSQIHLYEDGSANRYAEINLYSTVGATAGNQGGYYNFNVSGEGTSGAISGVYHMGSIEWNGKSDNGIFYSAAGITVQSEASWSGISPSTHLAAMNLWANPAPGYNIKINYTSTTINPESVDLDFIVNSDRLEVLKIDGGTDTTTLKGFTNIQSSTDTSLFWADWDTDKIGIGTVTPHSTLDIFGSLGTVITTKSAGNFNFYDTPGLSFILSNLLSTGYSGQLGSVSTYTNRTYIVIDQNTGTASWTIASTAANIKYNGASAVSSVSLSRKSGGVYLIVSDGSYWYMITLQ